MPKVKRLKAFMDHKIVQDSIVHSDTFSFYNVLDVSDFKHYRINQLSGSPTTRNYINGIENFWNQAKGHVRKFNGIPKERYPLFLKECQWRFNSHDPQP